MEVGQRDADSSCQNTAGHLVGQEREEEGSFNTFLRCIISEDHMSVTYIFIFIYDFMKSNCFVLLFVWLLFLLAIFPTSYENKIISLVDAGLAINSAYPLVLRAERQTDLILSFDFSSGDPFEVQCGYSFGQPPLGSLGGGSQQTSQSLPKRSSKLCLTGCWPIATLSVTFVWVSFPGSWQKQVLVEREPFPLSCPQVLYGNLPRFWGSQGCIRAARGRLTNVLSSFFA